MSKVVSSKFGQRELVELPPANASSVTSVPQKEARAKHSTRRPDAEHVPSHSPRNHLYHSGIAETQLIDYGYPLHGGTMLYPDGETVTVKEVFRPRVDQSVQTNSPHVQFARSIRGHDQQVQQGVHGSYSPVQQHYSSPAPTQQYYFSRQVPQVAGAAQPKPASQTLRKMPIAQGDKRNLYGNNPKERHIYYGPDGKVMPGPPPGVQMPNSIPGGESYPNDFQLDAVLEFGRVKSLILTTLDDNSAEFPKLPDYLLRCLEVKYGEYEVTDARIVYKGGQFDVYGVPQLAASGRIKRLPPPFEHLSEVHRYRTPPINEMP